MLSGAISKQSDRFSSTFEQYTSYERWVVCLKCRFVLHFTLLQLKYRYWFSYLILLMINAFMELPSEAHEGILSFAIRKTVSAAWMKQIKTQTSLNSACRDICMRSHIIESDWFLHNYFQVSSVWRLSGKHHLETKKVFNYALFDGTHYISHRQQSDIYPMCYHFSFFIDGFSVS